MMLSNPGFSTQPNKGDRLCLQIPALPMHVGQARHAVADFLSHQGWPQTDTDDIMLALGEAGSNAVSHGRESGAETVCIVCMLTGPASLEIEVRNHGEDFSPDMTLLCALPDQQATHGRGFALMQFLMDSVDVYHDGPETVVRLTKTRSGNV